MSPTSFLLDLFGLEGQVAVVIGGSGELGSAIGRGLARAGARVALVGRNWEKGEGRVTRIEEEGGEACFIQADVTRREEIKGVLQQTLERWQNVHILVNGAGINSDTPYLQISDEEWEQILRTDLTSVHWACQVFGAHFLAGGKGGCIINIASMSGIIPLSRVFTYSVSKAGVINLTQNLAREWAPHGIRVNAIAPGFFPAEQNRRILKPDRVEAVLRHTPMSRFGEAEELIGVTLLLASPKAGSFITGAVYVVDGGFSAMTI